ncbi:HAD family hydrolase [Spiroplasma corruscae]|uniref:HAD family hydrolase n=1 Tax=Spiroplasma corruscae TaxID=216934 RepID=A0A222EQ57_9MOLU|nr:HAD-IIB family hydrolase [Spiroplasma corruscae]ASP28657.1 HAD family hydrolase [Spiroplasma corruscae]
MNKFKLVVLDLDGTTCEFLGAFVDSNIQPIKDVIENKINVVFATGRPIKAKFNRLDIFGFNKYHSLGIGFNGALIYDLIKKEELISFPLDKIKAKAVFELLKLSENKDCVLCAYTIEDDLCYVTKSAEEFEDIKLESVLFEKPALIYNDECQMYDCYKILVFNANSKFKKQVEEIGLEIAWSEQSLAGEITRKGVNKRLALEYIANHLKIKPEEIIAMGDGENDVAMLGYAGLSISPTNACDNAKNNAKVVSHYSNLEGFVGIELKKYVLN